MQLQDFLQYNDIVIQCHDNPDADAIASGWALYFYFLHMGKPVRFVYGGRSEIQKSNLVLFTKTFDVPIEHVTALDNEPELLITTDCQYGERNVSALHAKNIVVIDHHQISKTLPAEIPQNIRPGYGSCATVVWAMLKDAGIDVNQCDAKTYSVSRDNTDRRLATALYYGLYTDTAKLQEISHPCDKDMRDGLKISASHIFLFQHTNLSMEEMKIAGHALEHYRYDEKNRCAIAGTEPCDPNLLGVISDLLIEVDVIDTCIVFCEAGDGIKLSVRSCVKETRADELAQEIAKGIGNGGGHLRKAGGYLNGPSVREEAGKAMENTEFIDQAKQVIRTRAEDYFSNTDILQASDDMPQLQNAPRYKKQRTKAGYARMCDVFPAGTDILVRTLEGDFTLTVDETLYMMIGVVGEIYPIRKSILEEKYETTKEPYDGYQGDYAPTVRDAVTGEVKELLSFANCCMTVENNTTARALPLARRTKLFTEWSEDNYMLGVAGDFLVMPEEHPEDKYIVRSDVFKATYQTIVQGE